MVRSVSLAAIAAAVAVASQSAPAVAQDHDRSTEQAAAALRALDNPETAETIGALAEGMMRSLMAMPVGPMADAVRRIDPDSPIADAGPDDRLGDVAGIDERDARRLGSDARAAGAMTGAMARTLADMLPTFVAMARDMGAQMNAEWQARRDEARRNAPRADEQRDR